MTGEAHDEFYGVPPEQRVAPPAITDVAPSSVPPSSIRPSQPTPQVVFSGAPSDEPPQQHTDQPFSDPEPRAESLDQGRLEPTPTVQQRKFSAPSLEWDATRSAPPAQSRPEASNFPSVQYDFNESKSLYHPPTSYPEPPKDMWYEVPQTKPEPEAPPKPIFPWEQEQDRPRPTRIFADDQPPEPPKPKEKHKPVGLQLPPAISVGDDTFTPFSPQANAWDSNPSIERYVRAVFESQNPKRAHKSTPSTEIMSPTGPTPGRRESLILTDFPSADDRPSLPVTPAPIRRPTFWGEERDEAGELPAAEGVPDQAEWVCPQCGFSSDTPVAFIHARSASTAEEHGHATPTRAMEEIVSPTSAPEPSVARPKHAVPAAAQPARPPSPTSQPQPLRNAWDDIPLPAHLRPRPKTRHSSSDFSSASTVVGPSTTATAGPDDLSKLGSDVPSPVVELRDEAKDAMSQVAAGESAVITPGEETAVIALADAPLLGSGEATPTGPGSPAKQILAPPAWLTGPLQQQG